MISCCWCDSPAQNAGLPVYWAGETPAAPFRVHGCRLLDNTLVSKRWNYVSNSAQAYHVEQMGSTGMTCGRMPRFDLGVRAADGLIHPLPSISEILLSQYLCNLHGIESRPFQDVVRHDPEIQAICHGFIFANASHECAVFPCTQRCEGI